MSVRDRAACTMVAIEAIAHVWREPPLVVRRVMLPPALIAAVAFMPVVIACMVVAETWCYLRFLPIYARNEWNGDQISPMERPEDDPV